MDRSRWISLSIAIVYLVWSAFDDLEKIGGMLMWLGLCLGCIWWGDELGEGLVGAKFGLISSPSPGWAVKLMGWILLFMPAILIILSLVRGH